MERFVRLLLYLPLICIFSSHELREVLVVRNQPKTVACWAQSSGLVIGFEFFPVYFSHLVLTGCRWFSQYLLFLFLLLILFAMCAPHCGEQQEIFWARVYARSRFTERLNVLSLFPVDCPPVCLGWKFHQSVCLSALSVPEFITISRNDPLWYRNRS